MADIQESEVFMRIRLWKAKSGVIGIAFTGIKGRFFLVMTNNDGVEIEANFSQKEFMYKGL